MKRQELKKPLGLEVEHLQELQASLVDFLLICRNYNDLNEESCISVISTSAVFTHLSQHTDRSQIESPHVL